MDIRSKKPEPFAQSEDQEDELLSIVAIKGHPHSIDALCNVPNDLPGIDATSTILTGSSDGFVRAVQILPTKLLGVVADHGEWPVERIAIGGGTSQLTFDDEEEGAIGCKVGGRKGTQTDEEVEGASGQSGRWWVGSVGHEEVVRLTDLEGFFHEAAKVAEEGHERALDASGEQEEVEDVEEGDSDNGVESDSNEPEATPAEAKNADSDEEDDSEEEEAPKAKKRKRKPEKNPLVVKKKGKNTVDAEPTFFNDL
ncbi:hypothetical protein DXG03_007975 [Asterophora parasitica]|uniref:Uncharacterized protein n=1 Tax=Asterophora parasitica TaxID=117018 RepID=A0A9P7G7J5_9AGAR|nr:hypothetical protein DXG03_007975 [Asterophora parasitica]